MIRDLFEEPHAREAYALLGGQWPTRVKGYYSRNPFILKSGATAGKVVLMRGPIVYCLEEVDSGPNLAQIVLPRDAEPVVEGKDHMLGDAVTLHGMSTKVDALAWGDELYAPIPYNIKIVPIRAIPYYAWANRTPGEMTVWIREG